MTSEGEIGFVTQSAWPLNGGPTAVWSAYDIALDTLFLLRLASRFWNKHGYKDTVRLVTELYPGRAKLTTERSAFSAIFHQQIGTPSDHTALDPGVFIGEGASSRYGFAQVDFMVDSLGTRLHEVTTSVLHKLVSGLGYEVDLPKLKASVLTIST